MRINKEKKQISFGLKASYFSKAQQRSAPELPKTSDEDISDNDELSAEGGGVALDDDSNAGNDRSSANGIDIDNLTDTDSDVEMNGVGDVVKELTVEEDGDAPTTHNFQGLTTGGFDWNGGVSGAGDGGALSETDAEASQPKKKKRRKAEIKVDKTGDLDANGPQSVADFERLLLGQPNSSILWLSYMAFQLQLSEFARAREIAERALKTINMREENEKMNVWIALLNLENTYGSNESLEEVFKRACQYNDSQEIHERLVSIYIQSGKNSKADELFQSTLKKHGQSPDLYTNYATFLMTTMAASDRARALLPRAMQALPQHTHLALTSKFAQLEFNSPNGDPERGRTIFETLLSQWPKRLDLWNVLLDLEIKQGDQAVIRRSFERVTISSPYMKPQKAKFFFKKWLDYEGKAGDSKSQERVKALAAEYVRAQGKQGAAE